jgi:adenine-specific DNA methylase
VEYYCPHCDLKGYKATDEGDFALYEKARAEFEAKKDELPIPEQKVPMGYNTKQMINYGYHYFRDMFNERQLLCLGKLLRAIMEIKEKNVREVVLITFSDTLRVQTMLSIYDYNKHHILNLFKGHAYHPAFRPVENNLWGVKYGRGTFSREVEKIREGKRFAKEPFEKYVDGNKLQQATGFSEINGKLVASADALGQKGNALLLCRSSDYLPLDPESVDLILTDPPYYDNVMYSELSDFFYVWLRLALKDEYPHFRAELTPKTKEVIKNEAQGKGEEEFLEGLRAIFAECYRVLKDDGLMVFTFHHKQDEAWSAVLEAVLKAGFYITASWPIHSEMSSSTHIYDKKNISYDTIIVARKREGEGERISWRNLEDQIYERAEEIVRYYAHENGHFVSEPDMGIIAQGKCLELYSKHYPNVMEGGKPVSVKEAVKRTTNIVTEQLIEDRFQTLATQTDTLSALYLMFLAGRDTISYNALNKWLRGRGADVEDFTDRDLLRHEGDILRVTDPIDRRAYIEGTTKPLAVDGAHYLYYVIKQGDLQAEARRWADSRTIAAAKELYRITRDKAYERIAKYLERVTS